MAYLCIVFGIFVRRLKLRYKEEGVASKNTRAAFLKSWKEAVKNRWEFRIFTAFIDLR